MPAEGTETILLVDDESAVLTMAQAMLSRYGYRVVAAPGGREALDLCKCCPNLKIDLAVIDVVMQDMAGPELARELQEIRPALPILFMTGFMDQHQLLAAQNLPVLHKQFTSVTLVRRIREVLDRPKSAAAAP